MERLRVTVKVVDDYERLQIYTLRAEFIIEVNDLIKFTEPIKQKMDFIMKNLKLMGSLTGTFIMSFLIYH